MVWQLCCHNCRRLDCCCCYIGSCAIFSVGPYYTSFSASGCQFKNIIFLECLVGIDNGCWDGGDQPLEAKAVMVKVSF